MSALRSSHISISFILFNTSCSSGHVDSYTEITSSLTCPTSGYREAYTRSSITEPVLRHSGDLSCLGPREMRSCSVRTRRRHILSQFSTSSHHPCTESNVTAGAVAHECSCRTMIRSLEVVPKITAPRITKTQRITLAINRTEPLSSDRCSRTVRIAQQQQHA